MDLIVCYEHRIEQICGQQLKTMQSLTFTGQNKFIDCAISPVINYVSSNYQV